MLWDRRTGHPLGRAIVWQDTRTDELVDRAARAARTRRPSRNAPACRWPRTSPRPRIRWLLDHTPGLRERAERGEVLFGTMESWLIWNLTGGVGRRRARHRRHQRQPHAADEHPDPAVGPGAAGLLRRAGRDAAGDPVRPPRSTAPRHACCPASRSRPRSATSRRRCSARPASRRGEAKCTYGTGSFLLLNTGDTPVRSTPRPAHHGRLPHRHGARGLRAGRLDRGHRLAGPVVPRQPRADHQRAGDRDAGAHGRGQRRLLHRPGVLRPVRAALAQRRPRHHRRADLVHHQGPPGPRGAGGDRLADPRGGRRDERRLRAWR